MTVLFVSPHFDDVALSCVAHVLAARRLDRVVVATVFGAEQPEREAENREALRLLGVEPVVLAFTDAPARLAIRPSFASLLLDRYQREASDRDALGSALQALQSELHATRVFLPLGVGGHVDHRVVHDCHRALHGEVLFYEDRPYANVPGAVRARLLAIGADAAAACLAPFPDFAMVRDGVLRVFGSILSTQPDRHASVERYCQSQLSTTPGPTTLQLEPETLPTDPITAEVIACYRSQFGDLFGDLQGLDRFLADSPVERVWKRTGPSRVCSY